MDKNTLVGLLLIGAIFIGFSYLNAPSEAEIEAAKKSRDSIAFVQNQKAAEEIKQEVEQTNSEEVKIESPVYTELTGNDSILSIEKDKIYGAFASSAQKEGKHIVVETDKFRLTFNTLGGKIEKVELLDYLTYEGKQLVLFDSTSQFNLNFFTKDSKNIYTDELVFDTDAQDIKITGSDSKSISFKLNAGAGRYLEYNYQMKGDDYQLKFDVNLVGMNQVLDNRTGEMYLNWSVNAPNQEKSLKSQHEVTTIFYMYKGDEVDDLTATSDEKEEYEASIKWVSLKQQFFNSAIIADDFFSKSRAFAQTETDETSSDYVKRMTTALTIPVVGTEIESFGMSLYLGPNDYDLLTTYENGLHDIINLGWGIFGWVNKYAVIPVFDFLDGFDMNYGIIILILTILLKLVLSPITYKTYLSGAKMRVLKPEINELNEKYKDDAMKKQQAMMSLYKQTGVNPLSGCIPMLIQMPILIAMFRFFPASIQLRQESFLWADDLSSYDSIFNFPEGFSIPFYGDHVSLFTILMAISLAFYTKMNSSMTMGAASEGPMAQQMKIMTYLMPVMMLFFFNSYSAGLSYYYFLANVISMGQTLLIRKMFINEDAIRAKIETNKKRPQAKKKSGFQKRLEEMAKQKGYQAPKKK